MISHFHVPDPTGGLATRVGVLARAGAVSVSYPATLLATYWDTVLVDTYPEGRDGILRDVLPVLRDRGTRLVLLARALNVPEPIPAIYDEVIPVGPYEGHSQADPIIEAPTPADRDIPVLLVVGSQGRPWYRDAIKRLPGMAVLEGRGVDYIGHARVVVGGGGTGTLYETLWSGGRLVAHPFLPEQRTRIIEAQRAGEAIVPVWSPDDIPAAIERVQSMTPLGVRPAMTRARWQVAIGTRAA